VYTVKGYCAGILLFNNAVEKHLLEEFLQERVRDLKNGNLTITFAMGVTQNAKEMCVDVYDKETGRYLTQKSCAFKT